MSGDLNAALSDYAEESILFTSKDPVRRLQQLRSFMEAFLSNLSPGMSEALEMAQQNVEGAVTYILWKTGSFAPLGTDAFIVRDGNQAFAAYTPSST